MTSCNCGIGAICFTCTPEAFNQQSEYMNLMPLLGNFDPALAGKWLTKKGWESFWIDKGKDTVYRKQDTISPKHLYTLWDAVKLQMTADINYDPPMFQPFEKVYVCGYGQSVRFAFLTDREALDWVASALKAGAKDAFWQDLLIGQREDEKNDG